MYNPYLVVPLLVWAITQFLKFVIAAASGRVDFRYLYASGGMPSVHSAVVTSLATTALLIDGPKSSLFGITAVLAAIVMYDSFGVRRASGEQAAAINLILDSMDQDRIRIVHPTGRMRELLGHKPLEVTIGALLGFVLAGLFNISRLGALLTFLSTPIGRPLIFAIAALSLVLILGAFVGRPMMSRRYRKIEIAQEVIRRSFWSAVLIGLLGLVLSFFAYEKVSAALWLIWPCLYLAIGLLALGLLNRAYKGKIPQAVASQSEQQSKERWLEGPNKKRRAARDRSRRR